MNIAVIFAGGSGQRMHSKDKPKQFLIVDGKPIIVHTIEAFEKHSKIDGIVVSCIREYIPYVESLKHKFCLDKINKIVPGGATGQLSIYNGLLAVEELFGIEDTIVLIHDGVRPLVSEEEISANIVCVQENGSAITCARTKETFVLVDDAGEVKTVPSRTYSFVAKAPQSFYLRDVLNAQRWAISQGRTNIIDSCTLMQDYGHSLFTVNSSHENIKITTPDDFYIFCALYDAKQRKNLV